MSTRPHVRSPRKLDWRHAVILGAMALWYAILIYTSRGIAGDTIVLMTAVASIFTPMLALASVEKHGVTGGDRAGQCRPPTGLARSILYPAVMVFAVLVGVILLLDYTLLYRAKVWMHVILVSLQAAYQAMLVWLIDWLGAGPRGRRIGALILFAVYPAVMLVYWFPREVSTAMEIILARASLMVSYPALLFSPDEAPPVRTSDYTLPTFIGSLVYMTIAIILGLAYMMHRHRRCKQRGYE
ncbi:MAG: hypothetical protein GSR78_05425 [Desulfurococcales archaeon]|nr:hypothetical protein [Desulfurococcales archaeon]